MFLLSQEQKDGCHGVDIFPAINKLMITLHCSRYFSVAMLPPTHFMQILGYGINKC